MENVLICQICSSSYEDPRILSCLHSYCLKCIQTLHYEGSSSVVCPSCNDSTTLPEGGVVEIPQNSYLREETIRNELIQKVISLPSPICDSCEEDSQSVAYCRDCEDFLCDTCWSIHRKIKITRSHVTFDLAETRKSERLVDLQLLPNPDQFVPHCLTHDLKLSFYCKGCAIPICAECGHKDHKNHYVQELTKWASATKSQIEHNIKELSEGIQQVHCALNTAEEAKRNVRIRKGEMINTITQTFTKLRALIDKQEKTILVETNNVCMAKETRLSIEMEKLQELLDSVNFCSSFAALACKEYNEVQLLSIAETLHNRAISLDIRCKPTSSTVCETPEEISFTINTKELVGMLSDIVTITDNSLLFQNATAIVPRRRLAIGAEMNVIVTLGVKGKGQVKVNKLLTANLASDTKIFQCPITENKDGTCSVTVIPKCLGQHQFSITINNRHIQNSPFNIIVVNKTSYTKGVMSITKLVNVHSPSAVCVSEINDDVFVASKMENCINVYNSSGQKKFTIDSVGNSPLQIPWGIDVVDDIIYIAQSDGHNILKSTTRGELLDKFGEKGSGIGQFNYPSDVKISPNRMICVSDNGNNRIQIFNYDFTISHVIDASTLLYPVAGSKLPSPVSMAFDLHGDIHVTWFESLITVHSLRTGQLVRRYDETRTPVFTGIAIDASGYSIVDCCNHDGILLIDPSGRFSCFKLKLSLKGSCDLAISPNDGSLLIADTGNDRIIKCTF